MAKADKEVAVVANNTAIATVTTDMYEQDVGAGMEGATQESFAIPFLGVLQKGSPQVDEALGQAIEGAKAGMFFDNVTQKMFDGKKGVTIIPCAYRRVFIRWGNKALGGGFKGEITPEIVAQMRDKGEIVELDNRLYVPLEGGAVDPKQCDTINDTRNHYVLLVDEETGGWSQVLISLASTQIKKSKNLMAALASVKVQGAAGMYTPPTFANMVKATSLGESNDKGSWFGIKFEIVGKTSRVDLYNAAKELNETVKKGQVEAKYESAPDAAAHDDEKF